MPTTDALLDCLEHSRIPDAGLLAAAVAEGPTTGGAAIAATLANAHRELDRARLVALYPHLQDWAAVCAAAAELAVEHDIDPTPPPLHNALLAMSGDDRLEPWLERLRTGSRDERTAAWTHQLALAGGGVDDLAELLDTVLGDAREPLIWGAATYLIPAAQHAAFRQLALRGDMPDEVRRLVLGAAISTVPETGNVGWDADERIAVKRLPREAGLKPLARRSAPAWYGRLPWETLG